MSPIGVDHGVRGRRTSPPEFGVGDANANYPPKILSHRYKTAFKIRQNSFSAGVLPLTPLEELTTLPEPLVSWGSGHPFPYPTPLGTDPPSALAMRPPEFQPDLRL